MIKWPLYSVIIMAALVAGCASKDARSPNASPIGKPAESPSGDGDTAVVADAIPNAFQARPRTIDVKHVAIDLRFDWQKKQAYGTAAITLAPLSATNTITLDAGNLTIASIALANGVPLAFTYDGGDGDDALAITLDRIHPAGADLTLTVAYRTNWVNVSDPNNIWGSDGKGIRFFEPTSTEPVKRRQIWSMGWPQSNRYWFPGRDSPDDLRTAEFSATVAQPLMAISNGTLVETQTNADGTRTFHWRADTAFANHLSSFVVGEYVDIKQAYAGIDLHSFGYPDEAAAVAASVVRLPDMVEYFSRVTGAKYPHPSYSQVFVQDLPWGWGNAATSTLTENMVDDEPTHADYRYLWDALEAEALAHQWFGGYLSSRDWRHVWLNRGFAHEFDGLYNEHKNGRTEFLMWQHMGDLSFHLADWNAGIRHPIVPADLEQAEAFATDNYPSIRGALVLHMLRKHLDEDTWWKAVRLYVKENAGKSVSTEQWLAAVESASGESMGWFFDQWLYKIGHPIFDIAYNYDPAAQRLTLTAKQTQAIDPAQEYPQVEYFQGKVDIEIDGSITQVRLEPKADNVFTFASAQKPKLVNFDFENTWIKELTFAKPIDELLYQVQNDKDVLGKRWAMAELVKLGKDEKTSSEDKARIVAGLREAIASPSYWRVRVTAIAQLQSLLAPATANQPVALDDATVNVLLAVIEKDTAWVRAGAIALLATTRDAKYTDLYRKALKDASHPVSYAAATALGQSKSPTAFRALTELMTVPSWKGENRISGLNGLKELGDARGVEAALDALSDQSAHRWTLATSRWDYRIGGAETLVALGKGGIGYPIVFDRFQKSMRENDVNDIFSNVLLITTLADPRGQQAFDQLKTRFADDTNALAAVNQYEAQFQEKIKSR